MLFSLDRFPGQSQAKGFILRDGSHTTPSIRPFEREGLFAASHITDWMSRKLPWVPSIADPRSR